MSPVITLDCRPEIPSVVTTASDPCRNPATGPLSASPGTWKSPGLLLCSRKLRALVSHGAESSPGVSQPDAAPSTTEAPCPCQALCMAGSTARWGWDLLVAPGGCPQHPQPGVPAASPSPATARTLPRCCLAQGPRHLSALEPQEVLLSSIPLTQLKAGH